jgi:hypothetical protein
MTDLEQPKQNDESAEVPASPEVVNPPVPAQPEENAQQTDNKPAGTSEDDSQTNESDQSQD